MALKTLTSTIMFSALRAYLISNANAYFHKNKTDILYNIDFYPNGACTVWLFMGSRLVKRIVEMGVHRFCCLS